MAENNDSQEKVHDPTPQRLEQARKDGDVPQSRDLNTAASYVALWVTLAVAGGGVAAGSMQPLLPFIGAPGMLYEQVAGPGGRALTLRLISDSVMALMPLFAAPAIGVLVSLLGQRAIVASTKKITPKLDRISPISNAKQKFGADGLVEFVKSVLKLTAIGAVLTLIFWLERDYFAALITRDGRALISVLHDELLTMTLAAAVIVGVIGVMDYAWQRYSHRKKLRLSHQELRDELKKSEGDPTFKHTRRERGRKIAMNQMLADVPKADVVIVNPTHYAVALKWSRNPGAAPTCVAKGVDGVALRIREVAAENRVPIHSDPPTARALEATVEIGDEIKPEHYQAVAVAIRFADTIRKRARGRVTPS